MAKSHILIGSECFHYWFNSLQSIKRLEAWLVNQFKTTGIIDGIELSVGLEELKNWVVQIRNGHTTIPHRYWSLNPALTQCLIQNCLVTIHLPPLALFNGKEKWLSQAINTIFEMTGISQFTAHPDELSLDSCSALCAGISKGIEISIENMDIRKANYQTLPEISALLKNFPALTCTFDICHWLESGQTANSPELIKFIHSYGERISKIHFSVPTSSSQIYSAQIETFHYLAAGSGVTLPHEFYAALPNNINWVIEGVIPANNFKCIYDEVNLIQNSIPSKTKRSSYVGAKA